MIEQVKGTRNLFGAESEKYIHIFNTFSDAFVDYGYELVELPILEHKELFIKSIGENSEIVTKQMYEFKDKGDRSLVLRPEATASVVRFHNEFFKNESKKYSYFGKMYRYESPQKNRYREFIQAGAELIGTIDDFSELQILKSSINFLEKLDIKAKLNINTIGSIEERKLYIKALPKNLPDYISVDISNLHLNDKVTIQDLLNDNYAFVHPENMVVCQVKMSRASLSLSLIHI